MEFTEIPDTVMDEFFCECSNCGYEYLIRTEYQLVGHAIDGIEAKKSASKKTVTKSKAKKPIAKKASKPKITAKKTPAKKTTKSATKRR